MKECEAYGFLTEVFREVFMRDDIVLRSELTASDVDGWDSFKQIEIILATEERFGIKISTKELDRLEPHRTRRVKRVRHVELREHHRQVGGESGHRELLRWLVRLASGFYGYDSDNR